MMPPSFKSQNRLENPVGGIKARSMAEIHKSEPVILYQNNHPRVKKNLRSRLPVLAHYMQKTSLCMLNPFF